MISSHSLVSCQSFAVAAMSPIWTAELEEQLSLFVEMYPNDWATINSDMCRISDQTFLDSQLAQNVQELEGELVV